ncbi:head-tail connector protein [Wielerella bovis]|uniref:head-tail connector protein n=1 Tax=Wielerella bovis TaxID=2917790 RepID=UPI002018529D|nr:head-tail connector protein [Wielerella bovis]ULJ64186.1 head-tail connector protein [Wielerella bovis]
MVTLEIAKLHARIDGDDENVLLDLLLQGAIEHCCEYLNTPLFETKEEKGEQDGVVLNADIQTAILLVFSWRYAQREDQESMPVAAQKLLDKYRKHAGL